MVMNRDAVEEFTAFLETLRNRLNDARNRLAEAESEVGRLESRSRVVEDAIAAYLEDHDMPMPVLPMNGVHGDMTLTERRRAFLRDWARRNSGRLVLRETRDAMIQGGLFRDAMQFRQQMGRLMSEMECWERITGRRGTYRLVSLNGGDQAH